MKRTILFIVICLLLSIPSPGFGEISVTTAVRYNVFKDNGSPKTEGDEFTFPLSLEYTQGDFSLSLETAYSSANVAPENQTEAKLSGLTDTLLSITYSYPLSGLSMGIITGLDINLPTGKAQLNVDEELAEAGESGDLFDIDNFGDGLNVGLNLGITKDFKPISLVLLGAYIFNSAYDPTSDVEDDLLDPGDQALVVGMVQWQASSSVELGASVSYSQFTADKTNGKDSFRNGQQFSIGGNIRLARGRLAGFISLTQSFRDKSEILVEESLREESENSNAPIFSGAIGAAYQFSDKLTLRAEGDVRYYNESDLKDQSSGLPYSGRRVRYAAGPGFLYNLNENLSCSGLFQFFTLDEKRDMYAERDLIYKGFALNFGVTHLF